MSASRHDDRLARIIANEVAAGRSVSFDPVAGFPDWVEIVLVSADGVATRAEASCRRDEVDVAAVLRRLAAQMEG
jgi:hypothetical protein